MSKVVSTETRDYVEGGKNIAHIEMSASIIAVHALTFSKFAATKGVLSPQARELCMTLAKQYTEMTKWFSNHPNSELHGARILREGSGYTMLQELMADGGNEREDWNSREVPTCASMFTIESTTSGESNWFFLAPTIWNLHLKIMNRQKLRGLKQEIPFGIFEFLASARPGESVSYDIEGQTIIATIIEIPLDI